MYYSSCQVHYQKKIGNMEPLAYVMLLFNLFLFFLLLRIEQLKVTIKCKLSWIRQDFSLGNRKEIWEEENTVLKKKLYPKIKFSVPVFVCLC